MVIASEVKEEVVSITPVPRTSPGKHAAAASSSSPKPPAAQPSSPSRPLDNHSSAALKAAAPKSPALSTSPSPAPPMLKSALKGSRGEEARSGSGGRVTVQPPPVPASLPAAAPRPPPPDPSPAPAPSPALSAPPAAGRGSGTGGSGVFSGGASKGGTMGRSSGGNRKSGSGLSPLASKAANGLQYLQHQAAVVAWIEALTKQPFPTRDPTPGQFLAAASDGVLLCRAMQEVDERAIPRIHTSKNPVRIRDNLTCFLEACREVVECAFALGRLCTANGFRPALPDKSTLTFPPARADALVARFGRRDATTLDAVLESDAARLAGLAPPTPAPSFSSLPSTSSTTGAGATPSAAASATSPRSKAASPAKVASPGRSPGRSAAVDLKKASPATIRAFTRLQAIVRGRRVRNWYAKRRRDLAYRDRVAQEILSTEQSYVRDLQILMRVFVSPLYAALKEDKPVLGLQELKTIFGEIEVILNYNQELLRQLEPRVKAWSPSQCLGDIFLSVCKFLKVYTQYIRNYNQSLATIAQCGHTNKKFEAFLKQAERAPELRRAGLDSFLILPVQRIPRYIMLLNELKKHTWEEHRDCANIVAAWTQMQEVANYVLEVRNKIEGVFQRDLLEAHRKFVCELAMEEVKDKKKGARTLFVFNDLVLVTKPSGSGFKLQKEINLDPNRLGAVQAQDVPDTDSVKNCVTLVNDLDVVLLKFCTDTPQKKTEIIEEIKKLRNEFAEKQKLLDEQATKKSLQKAADFKLLSGGPAQEQVAQISHGGSMKMHKRREHPENVVKVKEIAKKINGKLDVELVVPERHFVKQIDVTVLEGKKKKHPRTLFLFDDLVLVTQPEKDQEKHSGEYKFLAMYPSAEMMAKDTTTGHGDGLVCDLLRGESAVLAGIYFEHQSDRVAFTADITSLRTKRNKDVRKESSTKQPEEKRADSEDGAADKTAAGGETGGGLRKWAVKREQLQRTPSGKEGKK